mmetsp:Transcript_17826/g.67281  ORF Transcript_17826/g.67281 Transcript_17826/m.67281 type:complete len:162 (-) Transcript_17826:230-715(-)
MALRGVYVVARPSRGPPSSQPAPRPQSRLPDADAAALASAQAARPAVSRRRSGGASEAANTASTAAGQAGNQRVYLASRATWWAAEFRPKASGGVTHTRWLVDATGGIEGRRTFAHSSLEDALAFLSGFAARLRAEGLTDSLPPRGFWSSHWRGGGEHPHS